MQRLTGPQNDRGCQKLPSAFCKQWLSSERDQPPNLAEEQTSGSHAPMSSEPSKKSQTWRVFQKRSNAHQLDQVAVGQQQCSELKHLKGCWRGCPAASGTAAICIRSGDRLVLCGPNRIPKQLEAHPAQEKQCKMRLQAHMAASDTKEGKGDICWGPIGLGVMW